MEDPVALFFEGQFVEAWTLHKAGNFEEANAICHRFLLEPELSTFFRAGFHYLLGYGPSDPVDHATAAVHLYRSLIPRYPLPALNRSEQILTNWFHVAEEALELASQRAIAYRAELAAAGPEDEAFEEEEDEDEPPEELKDDASDKEIAWSDIGVDKGDLGRSTSGKGKGRAADVLNVTPERAGPAGAQKDDAKATHTPEAKPKVNLQQIHFGSPRLPWRVRRTAFPDPEPESEQAGKPDPSA